MRFQKTLIRGRDRDVDQTVELEVRLEARQATVSIRNQSEAHAQTMQCSKRVGYVVIQREVMMVRPLVVELLGGDVDLRAGSAHQFDDAARETDEDRGIVERVR